MKTINFSINEVDLTIIMPILITIIFFIIFWFSTNSKAIHTIFKSRYLHDKASVNYFLFSKVLGFICLGIIPLIICLIWLPSYTLADYGFRVDLESTLFSLGCLFVLAIIIIPVVIKNAKKAENLENYPQIRSKIWTRKTMLINLFGWFIFLLAYEFLFRGLLLFPLVESLGVWPAIAINSSLYAATHIPKGLVETVGALLFGTLICIITIISGSIWTAFMAHLIISWTNSITALKYHPKIHFYSIPKWHQTSF